LQVFGAILDIGRLILNPIMLSQGSEYFVEAASKLARAAGISDLFIGFTARRITHTRKLH